MRSTPTLTPHGITRRKLAAVLIAAATAFAGVGLTAPGASAAPRPSGPAPAGLISYLASADDGTQQVFTMNADGSGKNQVTSNLTNTKKCDPMLEPTGRNEVAYAANDGRMYVHDLSNPAVAKDIAPPNSSGVKTGGRRPTYSADGNTIVFHFSVDSAAALPTYDLWMTNRENDVWTVARQITKLEPGQSAFHPRYSLAPGSDWLAYTFRAGPDAPYDLYVGRVSSREPAVTEATASGYRIGTALLPGSGALLATWSQSGNRIAYVKSCSAAVEYVPVTYGTENTLTAGAPIAVAQSGGCGLSWSRHSEDHLVYADTGRIYVKNVASSQRATNLGTGSMPSW